MDTRALRQRVAMIFQHHNVVPRLSALKNVLTGRLGAVSTLASVMHFFSRADIELAHECLGRVGLAHKAHERTDSLSGGQMQRVGIARALAQQPRLILADEPVASLDPQTSRKVLQYLHDASRDLGITVLCNLHQVDYAREFADRIVGLSQGRVVFDGAPQAMGQDDIDRIYMPQPAFQMKGAAGPIAPKMNMKHPSTPYTWTGPRPEGRRGWFNLLVGACILGWALQWSADGAQLSWSELA
eukprot:gene59766-79722_t